MSEQTNAEREEVNLEAEEFLFSPNGDIIPVGGESVRVSPDDPERFGSKRLNQKEVNVIFNKQKVAYKSNKSGQSRIERYLNIYKRGWALASQAGRFWTLKCWYLDENTKRAIFKWCEAIDYYRYSAKGRLPWGWKTSDLQIIEFKKKVGKEPAQTIKTNVHDVFFGSYSDFDGESIEALKAKSEEYIVLDELNKKQEKVKSEGKEIDFNSEDFWLYPGNEIIPIKGNPVSDVINDPKKFGFSYRDVEEFSDKTNYLKDKPVAINKIYDEDDILKKMYKRGWVRLQRTKYYWIVECWSLEDYYFTKDVLYSFCKALKENAKKNEGKLPGVWKTERLYIIEFKKYYQLFPFYLTAEASIDEILSGKLHKLYKERKLKVTQLAGGEAEYSKLYKEKGEALGNEQKEPDLNAKAFWLSPDNEIIPVGYDLIRTIIENPSKFGLSPYYPSKETYYEYADSRNNLLKEMYHAGWTSIELTNNSWLAVCWTLDDYLYYTKEHLVEFFKAIKSRRELLEGQMPGAWKTNNLMIVEVQKRDIKKLFPSTNTTIDGFIEGELDKILDERRGMIMQRIKSKIRAPSIYSFCDFKFGSVCLDSERTYAFISTYDENRSYYDNKKRRNELHKELKNLKPDYTKEFDSGWEFTNDKGEKKVIQEPFCFVADIKKDDAVKLGVKYNQKAIIYKDSESFQRISTNEIDGIGNITKKIDLPSSLTMENFKEIYEELREIGKKRKLLLIIKEVEPFGKVDCYRRLKPHRGDKEPLRIL